MQNQETSVDQPHQASVVAAPVGARWASTAEAAEYSGFSAGTLCNMRTAGDTPPYVKVGRKVMYDLNLFDDWLAVRSRTSTSEEAA